LNCKNLAVTDVFVVPKRNAQLPAVSSKRTLDDASEIKSVGSVVLKSYSVVSSPVIDNPVV